jgi:hypothetical protein
VAATTTVGALGEPTLLLVGELLGHDAHDLAGQTWRTEAACRGESPERWHPPRGASIEGLRRTCRGCSVRLECAGYALKYASNNFGVWAGTSGRERLRARRRGWDARRLLAHLDG